MKATTLIVPLILLAPVIASANEPAKDGKKEKLGNWLSNMLTGAPTYQRHWSNPKTPLEIDAAHPGEVEVKKAHDIGDVIYIRVKSIPPAHSHKYRHFVTHEESRRAAFVLPQAVNRPSTEESEGAKDGEQNNAARKKAGQVFPLVLEPPCKARLAKLKAELHKAETSSEVAPVVTKITLEDAECEQLKTALIDSTQRLIEVQVESNSDSIFTLSVTNDGKVTEVAKLTLEEKRKEWMTHAGWTFIDSRDRLYYSKAADDGTFTIEQQSNQPMLNHALTVMYTYPMATWGDDIHFGPAGMLGLGQNGLLVGLGVSLAFTENLAINVSLVASQFERLDGVYQPGQNVGTKAIDSSALKKDEIRGSIALTAGFRF
jgi:hypothetical protein